MDRGRAVIRELKNEGIRHIAWLPDSTTHFMQEAMQRDPDLRVIKVCREGEAVAICCGLHLGGSRGALLVENQGMFASGDILKWAINLNIPMVMMVGYLFFERMQRTAEGMMINGKQKDFTEPFLDAFGIKHYLVESDADVKNVGLACRDAQRTGRPVALLLPSADNYQAGT